MDNEHFRQAQSHLRDIDISRTDPELGYTDEACAELATSAQLHALLAIAELLDEISHKLGGKIRLDGREIARAVAHGNAQRAAHHPRSLRD